MARYSLPLLLSCVALASCVPTGEDYPRRGQKDLSDEPHYSPTADHNADYDHEAFLGKETAETFDDLPPGEARRRLGMIVDRIDASRDGFVSEKELEEWVRHVASRYVFEDADRQWDYHDTNKDNFISWEEYKENAFGPEHDDNEIYDTHRQLTFKQMKERELRRFERADQDSNKKLNKEEFAHFLHPEDTPHMRDIVVDETMADMDRNKDGYITLEEYINDLWPQYERDQGEEEPDWVRSEREQFHTHRDKDKDGRLNRKEIGDWILPEDYDHARAEARHLVYEADTNKDKQLTKEEILQHQDLFVGSQATDFGDYFMRHDEF